MNKGKSTAIEGQDLDKNVFRAFVGILITYTMINLNLG
jgi:hypothetical protein